MSLTGDTGLNPLHKKIVIIIFYLHTQRRKGRERGGRRERERIQ